MTEVLPIFSLRLLFEAMCHIMRHMKTVTIHQIQHDLHTVLAWVAEGEEIVVLQRSEPVARLCPPLPQHAETVRMPDFAARAKAVFGNRSTNLSDIVLEERENSRW